MGVRLSALIAVCALSACASAVPSTAGAPSRVPTAAPGLQPVTVASQTLVGLQRVPIGILYQNSPVNDARVHVRVYRNTPSDPQANEADAPFRGEGLQGKGLYVALLRFDAVGTWTAEITAEHPTLRRSVSLLPVRVTSASTIPTVGQPAPRSHNLTAHDVPDVSYIDSGQPPNDMHELSIAEAIAQHRPTLVVFATPAFCQSATCGPQVHAVQQLEPTYRDRLAFIHVEVYEDFKPDPNKLHLSATMKEWNLQTEPWVYLIDRDGVIRATFEAATASDEIRIAIDHMLASQP